MKYSVRIIHFLIVFSLSLLISGCDALAQRVQQGTEVAGTLIAGENGDTGPTFTMTLPEGEGIGGGANEGDDLSEPGAIGTAIQQTLDAQATDTPEGEVTNTTEPSITVSGAQLTGLAQTLTASVATNTPQPPTSTNTSAPDATDTPGSTDTPIGFVPSATAAPCNAMRFVADVTVPDGSVMQPNQVFYKTWRVQNIGSCTWSPRYSIVYFGGLQMSGKSPLQLGVSIGPGQYVNLTVKMTAPPQNGVFHGDWALMDEQGNIFGFGENFDQPFYVEIIVYGSGSNAPPPPFVNPASTDPGFTPAP